jgi:hypothetical protein
MINNEGKQEFGRLIERKLPDIGLIHAQASTDGFRAWRPYAEARVQMVPTEARTREAELISFCCREEFCNFEQYDRNFGGDGFQLPELHAVRENLREINRDRSPRNQACVLTSDTLMRTDHALAKKYARQTNYRANADLAAERSALLGLISEDTNANLTFLQNIQLLVRRECEAADLAVEAITGKHIRARRRLSDTADLLVELPTSHGGAASDWLNDLDFKCGIAFGAGKTIPLRPQGLAFGLAGYGLGIYVSGILRTVGEESGSSRAEEVEFRVEGESSSNEALAYSYATLGVRCYLRFLGSVDDALAAACREFYL